MFYQCCLVLGLLALASVWQVQAGPFLRCDPNGCTNVTCPPEPSCALDRIPCGCCNVCSLKANQPCHGFSASCGPGLVCVTPAGVFDQRPPWFSVIHGVCTFGVDPHFPVPPVLHSHAQSTPPSG